MAVQSAPMGIDAAAIAVLSEPEPSTGVVSNEPPLPEAPAQAASGSLGTTPFTEGELQILDNLEARLVGSVEPAQVINTAQLVSALVRLMLRKGLLAEAELIEELQKR